MDRTIAASAVGRNTFDLLPSLRTEAFTLKVNGFETGKHWYRIRLSSHATDDDRKLVFYDIGPSIISVVTDAATNTIEVHWVDTGNKNHVETFLTKRAKYEDVTLDSLFEVFYWEPQHQTALLEAWNSSSSDQWWDDVRALRGTNLLTFMVEEYYDHNASFNTLGIKTMGNINTTNAEHVKRITMHVGNELAKGVYFLDREPTVNGSTRIPDMPGSASGSPTSAAGSFSGASGSTNYKIPPMPGESDTARVAVAGWWGTKSNGKG
jgi:hypothetical protein